MSGRLYHIIFCAKRSYSMFICDSDRNYFLTLIKMCVVKEPSLAVHAYCLMNQYAHVLIQIDELKLKSCLAKITKCYRDFLNTRLKEDCVWCVQQCHSILLNSDTHFLNVLRYIERCPTSENVVGHPLAYQWSSYKNYVNQLDKTWLSTSLVLSKFSNSSIVAVQAYCDFIMQEQYTLKINQSWLFVMVNYGSQAFERVMQLAEQDQFSKAEIINSLLAWWSKKMLIDLEIFTQGGNERRLRISRVILALILHESQLFRFKELAKLFSVSANSLACSTYLLKQRLRNHPKHFELIDCLSGVLKALKQ